MNLDNKRKRLNLVPLSAPVGIEHHRYNSVFKNQQVIQIVIYQRQIQEVIIATDSNGGEKLL